MSTSLARLAPATPALPPAVRQAAALLAPDSPERAAKLSADELADELLEPISGVAFLLGHSRQVLAPEDLNLLASAVAEMVKRRFPGLTPAEIALAWRRGASGEYAEPNVLDLVAMPTLARWLDRYAQGERKQALALVEAPPPVPALPAPRRDPAAELVALVAQARAGQLPPAPELDFANVLYEWLKASGALAAPRWPAGPPDYEAFRVEEAEALMQQPTPLSKTERRQRNTFIDILADGAGWPEGHPLAKSVSNACKKRVLWEWLRQHAAAKTDVAALLTATDRRA